MYYIFYPFIHIYLSNSPSPPSLFPFIFFLLRFLYLYVCDDENFFEGVRLIIFLPTLTRSFIGPSLCSYSTVIERETISVYVCVCNKKGVRKRKMSDIYIYIYIYLYKVVFGDDDPPLPRNLTP